MISVRRLRRRGHAERGIPSRALSVRSRILVSILLVTALGLAAAGAASYLVQRERVLSRVDVQLLHTVEELKTIAAGTTSASPPATVDAVLRLAVQQIIPARDESTLGLINDKPALISAVNLPFRIDRDPALVSRIVSEANRTRVVIGTAKTTAGTLRYLIIPVSVAGDANTGLYVAAYDLDTELAAVADSFRIYVLVASIALILVGLVAWFVAGRLLRPIRLLRHAAAQSSTAADLTERIPVTGRDDVSELAMAINGMFDRLQASSLSQRQLIDDVGHELKTPITIIRGHLELLDPGNIGDVEATRSLAIDELDRMSTLVTNISLLAESGGPRFVELTETDITSLTTSVASKASALDAARRWEVETASGLAMVDVRRVTQAWLQLADNAVKYSTPGAPIVISSEIWQTRTATVLNLSVRDSGPGIPQDAQERIFERFARLESSKTAEGSGLGLAIVAAIAHAHGGTILLSSAPGEGSIFTIQLPLIVDGEHPVDNSEEQG
ncbi:MAG: sensor histidine kinase [Microbacteriaceae bacterium]